VRLFVAARIGTGTRADPFRPDVTTAVAGGRLGCVQLTANRFLCVAPNAAAQIPGSVDLGDTVGAVLNGQRLNRAAAALDLTTAELSGLTIGEALLLWFGSGLKSANGRWRIRLAGVDLYDAPLISGGATDAFTYSNGAVDSVSGGLWVAVDAAPNVVSNAISFTDATLRTARWSTAFAGDHYSQVVYTTSSGGEAAVITRVSSSTNSYYYAYEVTAGSFALLDSTTGIASSGTLRSESVGSLQTVYRNAVEILSATDSSLAANNFVGIGSGANPATIDDWDGGSIGGAATGMAPNRRHQALTYR
jgi:hypothetical protein